MRRATLADASASEDAKKTAREELQTFQRYQAQRSYLYQDSFYQGFADTKDLESFREERRSKRGGKKP